MKKDIRHFVLETKELGTFDVVEYKEYQELQERIDKAIEYIEQHNDYFLLKREVKELLSILKEGEK